MCTQARPCRKIGTHREPDQAVLCISMPGLEIIAHTDGEAAGNAQCCLAYDQSEIDFLQHFLQSPMMRRE